MVCPEILLGLLQLSEGAGPPVADAVVAVVAEGDGGLLLRFVENKKRQAVFTACQRGEPVFTLSSQGKIVL